MAKISKEEFIKRLSDAICPCEIGLKEICKRNRDCDKCWQQALKEGVEGYE